MNKTQQEVKQIRQGNQGLFDTFYLSLRPKFIAWARKTHQYEVAESIELFQQAMLVTYENILAGKLDDLKSTLDTYVIGVGKNLIHNKRRTYAIQQKHHETVSKHYQVLAEEQTKDEKTQQLKALVKELFPKLKEGCQDLLKRFYFEEKRAKTIAEELGYSNEKVVRTQKSRCIQYLKKMLKERLQK